MAEKSSVTSKDAKFIQLWAEKDFDPALKGACAKTAGFSPSAASRSTGKIITSLIQNKKMQRELRKAGVNMKKLAEKIAEQLDAVHPLSNKTRFNPETGKWEGPPDTMARGKAIEIGTRLFDAFAPTRLDIDKRETKQIVFSAEVIHRLERFNTQRDLMRTGETFDVEPVTDQQG